MECEASPVPTASLAPTVSPAPTVAPSTTAAPSVNLWAGNWTLKSSGFRVRVGTGAPRRGTRRGRGRAIGRAMGRGAHAPCTIWALPFLPSALYSEKGRLESSLLEHKPTSAIMYERASPEAPLRGSKTTNTSQLPPPHHVQTTRANAQQRRRVASRRIASPKRHRASSHRGTHLRRESPAIANNIQANLKMSEDEDEFEAEERRKDEAGAKAAQELADKQQRHLNKKVRDDPLDPFNCNHRMVDGEVPSPQLAKPIDVPAHPELKICTHVTGP